MQRPRLQPAGVVHGEARGVVGAVADQDALIAGAAHRRAHRVLGEQPPLPLAAQRRLLGGGERPGQAAEGEQREDPPAQEPSAGVQPLAARNRRSASTAPPSVSSRKRCAPAAIAAVDRPHRRLLEQLDIGGQRGREAPRQGRRLHQHAAGEPDAGPVVRRAGDPGEARGVQPLIGLAQGLQPGPQVGQRGGTLARRRRRGATPSRPSRSRCHALDRRAQPLDAEAAEVAVPPAGRRLHAGDEVGAVDHETRAAPRGPRARAIGVEHRDPPPGRSSASRRAAARPVNPAPITAQSAFSVPVSRRGGGGGGRISIQPQWRSPAGTVRTCRWRAWRGARSGISGGWAWMRGKYSLASLHPAGWGVLPSESSPSVPLHSVEREGPSLKVVLSSAGPPSPPGRGTEGEDSEGRTPAHTTDA